ETVDLAPLVGEVLDSLRAQLHARNAIVRVQPNQSDGPTLATVGRFVEQIFVNLVSNAIKYNNGPLVEIEIGYERAGSPAFPPAAAGFGHAFFVKDNGIGIPEAHRDTVFRIFKRLHARDKYGGGTGAGLTIVKRLVERLGGDVWIEPRAEGGTTFWFTILEGDLRT
ncbi:MAG TPA: ATP-binding protein, partial [Polyangia bacterium]